MLFIIVIAIIVVLAVAVFGLGGAYYGHLFSEAHFREFHASLARAIHAATATPDNPESAAFITGGGVKTAVTFSRRDEGGHTLHISLSQSERATTHSFGMRFAFFVVAMLQGNGAELTPFFTSTGVRHLSFDVASPTVAIQDFDAAHARYRSSYEPIPFEYRDIEA